MSVNVTSQPGNNGIKPEAPTGQSATATAGGGATVSFTPSTNPGKGTANYVATSSPGSFTASAASSPITFSSGTLTANTAYTFTIVKQSGSGISSDASSATSSITAFYVPGAPTSVSAAATGTSKQITVSWTAPSANGSAITGYYIDYSTSSTFASGVTTTTSASTSKTITDAGWTNGTTVYFRVRAENAAGQSANSSTASDYPYAPPTFGTQTGTSTAIAPTSAGTTTVSSVSTTTATLGISGLNGGTLVEYERTGGSGGTTPSAASLTGLSEKQAYTWRGRVTNNTSLFGLASRITPNGSTTTLSLEYGTSTSYGTNGGSSNLGAGNSEVTGTFNLNNFDSAATIYWRITATYRGGTVQTTGSISRAVSNYYSTGVSFTTYGTYSYSGSGTLLIEKRSEYVNISSISVSLWGGGAGGATWEPGGGGGGGGITTASGRSSSSNVTITVGAGGKSDGYGSSTDYIDSGGGVYALRGTPGAYKQGGASTKTDGSYYYGDLGGEDPGGYHIWSGGGGGAGGAGGGGFYGENGGPGSGGYGIGGPGTYWSLGLGEGAGSGPPADGSGNANAGTGGGGRGGWFLSSNPADTDPSPQRRGGSGRYSITYVGPAATTAT